MGNIFEFDLLIIRYFDYEINLYYYIDCILVKYVKVCRLYY